LEIAVVQLLAAVHLLLEVECTRQAEFVEALEEHGDGSDLLLARVCRGFTHGQLQVNGNDSPRCRSRKRSGPDPAPHPVASASPRRPRPVAWRPATARRP